MTSLLYKKQVVERERALSHLKIGKQEVAPQSWIKKTWVWGGYSDEKGHKNILRDVLLSNKLGAIWNLMTINNKETLMGNMHIHPNNNKMLKQLVSSELESHTESPFIILGNFNARHSGWEHNIKGGILADFISRHNLEIHNDGIKTFTHPVIVPHIIPALLI